MCFPMVHTTDIDVPTSSLQRSFSNASSQPPSNTKCTSPPQPASSPKKLAKAGRGAPVSPTTASSKVEHTVDSSERSGRRTSVSRSSSIESVLSSCQPSLLHIAPILDQLGVRKDEHMRALARMREETRDREVKEEALKKGVTVVEWAILLDKLQSMTL